MHTFILWIHCAACLMLIMLVLLQPSKGGGFNIYGGGGDALFSAPSGTSFMRKAAVACAITFACTSLLLSILASRVGLQSVTMQYPARQAAPPAAPAQPTNPPPSK